MTFEEASKLETGTRVQHTRSKELGTIDWEVDCGKGYIPVRFDSRARHRPGGYYAGNLRLVAASARFAVVATAPLGSEMTCSVHENREEAEVAMAAQALKRGFTWSFRICEVSE